MAVISALGSIMNLSSELPVSFGNVIDVCVCVCILASQISIQNTFIIMRAMIV